MKSDDITSITVPRAEYAGTCPSCNATLILKLKAPSSHIKKWARQICPTFDIPLQFHSLHIEDISIIENRVKWSLANNNIYRLSDLHGRRHEDVLSFKNMGRLSLKHLISVIEQVKILPEYDWLLPIGDRRIRAQLLRDK